jgi:hypothetical protein
LFACPDEGQTVLVLNVIRKLERGRDQATPFYLQLGVLGTVLLVVIVVLAIVMPLYYASGGK